MCAYRCNKAHAHSHLLIHVGHHFSAGAWQACLRYPQLWLIYTNCWCRSCYQTFVPCGIYDYWWLYGVMFFDERKPRLFAFWALLACKWAHTCYSTLWQLVAVMHQETWRFSSERQGGRRMLVKVNMNAIMQIPYFFKCSMQISKWEEILCLAWRICSVFWEKHWMET